VISVDVGTSMSPIHSRDEVADRSTGRDGSPVVQRASSIAPGSDRPCVAGRTAPSATAVSAPVSIWRRRRAGCRVEALVS
jgi:hypothetical protein